MGSNDELALSSAESCVPGCLACLMMEGNSYSSACTWFSVRHGIIVGLTQSPDETLPLSYVVCRVLPRYVLKLLTPNAWLSTGHVLYYSTGHVLYGI